MDSETAVPALAALAQPSRLAVFRWLVELGPDGACPGDIAEKLAIPAATLSFHLKALQRAGLIESDKSGRFIRYRAEFRSDAGPGRFPEQRLLRRGSFQVRAGAGIDLTMPSPAARPSLSSRMGAVRALPHALGGAVHGPGPRAWKLLSGGIRNPWRIAARRHQPAGRRADLDHDHPDAAEDRFRRHGRSSAALARHRRDGVRQLGDQTVLDGAAGLDLHPARVCGVPAGRSARCLHRRA